MKYRVAIVDDSKKDVNALEVRLEQHDSFRVIGKAYNKNSGFHLVKEEKPDLLFLDVSLSDGEGLSLLKMLKPVVDWPMKVVFYTANRSYLIQAIRESAFDYLQKPFKEDELEQILSRYIESVQVSNVAFQRIEKSHVLMVKNDKNEIQFLRLQDIGYFIYNSTKKMWNAYLSDKTSVSLKKGVVSVDILALHPRFTQVHSSYIINLNYLMKVSGNKCVLYPPFDDAKGLTVSRAHLKELMDMFQVL